MRACVGVLVLAAFVPVASPAQSRTTDDPATVTAILTAVRGANPLLCELAVRTVETQWGWSGFGLRAPRDATTRAAVEVINQRRTGIQSVAALAAALGDDDACVRRIAAPLLGRVDHPSALAALRTALHDQRPETREAAAIGLGYTENTAAIPALLGGLQDAVARVRAASAMSLGEIEDRRAIGALVRLLREDRDDEVRAAAAWALGEIEG